MSFLFFFVIYIIVDEINREKDKYKSIQAEMDLTFADLSGY